jgi:hypothetical protein
LNELLRTDSHLHQFIVGATYYGTPDPEMMGFGRQTLSEKRYTVADLAAAVKRSFMSTTSAMVETQNRRGEDSTVRSSIPTPHLSRRRERLPH